MTAEVVQLREVVTARIDALKNDVISIQVLMALIERAKVVADFWLETDHAAAADALYIGIQKMIEAYEIAADEVRKQLPKPAG